MLSKIRRDLILVILSGVLVLVYAVTAGYGFPLDDSWIHQTFARNLATYGEWSFIPGQPTAASTSPLYTLMLTMGYLMGIEPWLWAHNLGWLALVCMAVVGAHLADRLVPDDRRAGWAAGLALLGTWHLIWAAVAGMETALFAMLTLACMLATVITLDAFEQKPWWAGLVAGGLVALLALARPEGILLGGLCGLWVVAAVIRQVPGRLALWIGMVIVGFMIIYGPYLLLNWSLTGGLLPNTASAKFAQHEILLQQPITQRLVALFSAILAGGQVLFVPGIIFLLSYARRRRVIAHWHLLLLVWPLGLVLLYALRLPADYQHGRYVMPALPALVVAGAAGMLLAWRNLPRRRPGCSILLRRVTTQAWVLATIVTCLAFVALLGRDATRTDVAIINEEMVTAALWLRESLPDTALLAVHDVGAVGYFAPRQIIDIAGLISPEVIPIVADGDALWAYLERNNATHLMAFPDQIPNRTADDGRLCEVFNTQGPTAQRVGGPNMAVYRLAWDRNCRET